MRPYGAPTHLAGIPHHSQYVDLPHKLVFIPYWIETTLNRANVDLAEVLYYDKIKSHVTMYDLAGMCALEKVQFRQRLGLDNAVSWQDFTSVLHRWSQDYAYGTQENTDIWNTLTPLSETPDLINDTYERLFTQKRPDLDPELTFKVVELKENHLGVVIYPGYFDGTPRTVAPFLDVLMQMQYQRHPLHVLAQRPVFQRYLSLLEKSSTAA